MKIERTRMMTQIQKEQMRGRRERLIALELRGGEKRYVHKLSLSGPRRQMCECGNVGTIRSGGSDRKICVRCARIEHKIHQYHPQDREPDIGRKNAQVAQLMEASA